MLSTLVESYPLLGCTETAIEVSVVKRNGIVLVCGRLALHWKRFITDISPRTPNSVYSGVGGTMILTDQV